MRPNPQLGRPTNSWDKRLPGLDVRKVNCRTGGAIRIEWTPEGGIE